ncbi:hypothetical protein QE444_001623 [Pseudomonas sp. SORGH_AS199]|nr:hypothetical protein [Pseudomonas sp. SORGH_AS_0199]
MATAADLFQHGAPDHRAGAAEEGGVPQVVAILHQAVEQLALVGHGAKGLEILLEGIRGKEEVRGLQHGQLRVLEEPAQADLQEGTRRHVVGIEDGDVFAVGDLQRRIEIAGLGMLVVLAHQVGDAGGRAEVAEVLATAVVEHVHPQLVAWPVDGLGRQDRQLHDAQGFVVGGDENVHGGPGGRISRQRDRGAAQRPDGLQIAEHQHRQGIEFGGHQSVAEHHLQRRLEAQGAGQAPVEVAQ